MLSLKILKKNYAGVSFQIKLQAEDLFAQYSISPLIGWIGEFMVYSPGIPVFKAH